MTDTRDHNQEYKGPVKATLSEHGKAYWLKLHYDLEKNSVKAYLHDEDGGQRRIQGSMTFHFQSRGGDPRLYFALQVENVQQQHMLHGDAGYIIWRMHSPFTDRMEEIKQVEFESGKVVKFSRNYVYVKDA